jgi:DNA-binding beta-propeller fold protein YncE
MHIWIRFGLGRAGVASGLGVLAVLGVLQGCGGMSTAARSTPSATAAVSAPLRQASGGRVVPAPRADRHNEYVFTDRGYYVYGVERHFALIETVTIPGLTELRDAVADAKRGFFYISYGTNHITKWDFVHERQVWDRTYLPGTDAGALAPGGGTLYMATGSDNPANWLVINTSDGSLRDTIRASGDGSHNTDISLDGRYVFLGIHNSPRMGIYNTATKTIRYVGGLVAGVRPIAVTGRSTYAFIDQTGLFGFSVASLTTGKDLFNVRIKGFPSTSTAYVNSGADAPSHGVALSPNERELWAMDRPNGMVHVFDLTPLPARPPRQIADIALGDMNSNEAQCSKSCFKEGWVQFSRDGKYVYVGDTGAVIDADTKRVIARLPALRNSRKHIEVDWYRGRPVWGSPTRSQRGYVR